MPRSRFVVAVFSIGAVCLFVPLAKSQPAGAKGKGVYTLEPVAETKLVMEGLANPNVRALGKLLRDKPADAEAWGYARGQALLIAETGNLLLIRPPKTASGEEPWMKHSTELRDTAAALARTAAAKDYAKSRAALAAVANACNRCHQAFRVPQRIDPFAEE